MFELPTNRQLKRWRLGSWNKGGEYVLALKWISTPAWISASFMHLSNWASWIPFILITNRLSRCIDTAQQIPFFVLLVVDSILVSVNGYPS